MPLIRHDIGGLLLSLDDLRDVSGQKIDAAVPSTTERPSIWDFKT